MLGTDQEKYEMIQASFKRVDMLQPYIECPAMPKKRILKKERVYTTQTPYSPVKRLHDKV